MTSTWNWLRTPKWIVRQQRRHPSIQPHYWATTYSIRCHWKSNSCWSRYVHMGINGCRHRALNRYGLFQLSEINEKLAEVPVTSDSYMIHILQRHRDILNVSELFVHCINRPKLVTAPRVFVICRATSKNSKRSMPITTHESSGRNCCVARASVLPHRIHRIWRRWIGATCISRRADTCMGKWPRPCMQYLSIVFVHSFRFRFCPFDAAHQFSFNGQWSNQHRYGNQGTSAVTAAAIQTFTDSIQWYIESISAHIQVSRCSLPVGLIEKNI